MYIKYSTAYTFIVYMQINVPFTKKKKRIDENGAVLIYSVSVAAARSTSHTTYTIVVHRTAHTCHWDITYTYVLLY